jgi:hypothetical protein
MQNDMSEGIKEIVFDATQWFCVDMLRFELRIELLEAADASRNMYLVDFLQSKTMNLTDTMNLSTTPSLLEMTNLGFNLKVCGV